MSTITPSYPSPTGFVDLTNCRLLLWSMTSADTGSPLMLCDYADKTVAVQGGTWGSATLVIEGSNDGTNFTTLTDPQGNSLSKTADFIETIQENPVYIRVSTSGGTNSVIPVRLICRR